MSVSVVTYNSSGQLPMFLESLGRQTDVTWEAFFFDNASRDDSRRQLEEAGLGSVTASEENVGYGRGHNHNAARCRGAYLVVLNPDLTFGPGLLAALSEHLEEHDELSLVGPHIVEGAERRPFLPRRFYPGEGMVALAPGLRRAEIAWLSGCCFIIRRAAFEALGGFDPDYFLYQEDTDLCFRARRAGHRIGHLASCSVHHLHRRSQAGLSEYQQARRVFEGSVLFLSKHYAAADVVRMARFQYWVSLLLLHAGAARSWLPGLARVLGEARLRARRDVWLQWLETRGHGRLGITGLPGRIALRQCRLVVEWIRQRRFPLDDY